MIIRQASLTLRYYTADGWTRQAVADLLGVPDPLRYVIPRYWSRDIVMCQRDQTTEDREPHPEADYYAVYAMQVEPTIGDPRLAEHEVLGHRT